MVLEELLNSWEKISNYGINNFCSNFLSKYENIKIQVETEDIKKTCLVEKLFWKLYRVLRIPLSSRKTPHEINRIRLEASKD